MKDCIFCHIVSGQQPAYKVYEDDRFLAFLDIYPMCEGHTQVIPKQHYRWVWDMPDPGDLLLVCQKIVRHYNQVLNTESGFAFIFGEHVPHAHIQILPNTPTCFAKFKSSLAGLRQPKLEEKYATSLVKRLKLE